SNVERTVLRVGCAGAALLCLAFGVRLLLAPWALADELGRWPLEDYLATGFGRASLVHLACAGVFLAACLWLARGPARAARWWLAGAAATVVMASGAALVHAVSRLEHAGLLMAATLVHQLAAAIWAGGVIGLAVLARHRRRGQREAALWARA